jgi:hypothetical protein
LIQMIISIFNNNSVFETAAYHLRLYFKIWKHVVFPFIREIYLSGFLDMCHQHNTGNYQIVGSCKKNGENMPFRTHYFRFLTVHSVIGDVYDWYGTFR